jgi:tRNA(Ile2) C34 agmatinyltransferase TiaS
MMEKRAVGDQHTLGSTVCSLCGRQMKMIGGILSCIKCGTAASEAVSYAKHASMYDIEPGLPPVRTGGR